MNIILWRQNTELKTLLPIKKLILVYQTIYKINSYIAAGYQSKGLKNHRVPIQYADTILV